MIKDSINILVLDDDPIIIMSFERVLKAGGHNVEGVNSAEEAMQRIQNNDYDLLLTGLDMLEISGTTLIKWIKQFRPATDIVVITVSLLHKTIKEALKLGTHDHKTKQLIPLSLKESINRKIQRKRGNAAEHKPKEAFPPSMLEELDRVIHQYRNEPVGIIPVLLRAQEIFGHLPDVIQKRIARGLNIYPSEVRSIVSFYSCFRTNTEGEQTIKDCALKSWNAFSFIKKYSPVSGTAPPA